MEYDDRFKLKIFEGRSTYENDFRRYPDHRDRVLSRWPQETAHPVRRKAKAAGLEGQGRLKCQESMREYHTDAVVPFTMLWRDKPITGRMNTDRTIIEPPRDLAKDEVIKTRPRLYVSPAASIDDVDDKEMRSLLLDYMYTTQFKKAENDAVSYVEKKNAAQNRDICKTHGEKEYDFMVRDLPNPMEKYLPRIFPKLEPGWRDHFEDWDTPQLRSCVDPTRNFWVNKDPPVKINACVDPMAGVVSPEMQKEIADVIAAEKIRLPHDKPMQGYTGYRPTCATGIPFKKVEFPTSHPYQTTLQSITSRYAEDLKKKNN